MSDDTELDDVVNYLKLIEIVTGMAVTAWFVWAMIVPVAVKIDLRAWWNETTKSRRNDMLGVHRSLIDIEVATEAELAAAVERLSRAA
jgi:hypothetical protein